MSRRPAPAPGHGLDRLDRPALFTILFGTRNLDVTEHHRGMVPAIAFESLIKLLAFLAVGAFVTFGLYNGFGDLFNRAHDAPELADFWARTSTGQRCWFRPPWR